MKRSQKSQEGKGSTEQQVMLDRMVLAVKNAHKAIQVLKEENEKLKSENDELKKKIVFYEKKEKVAASSSSMTQSASMTRLVPQQQYRLREEDRDDHVDDYDHRDNNDKPVESLLKEDSAIPKLLKSVSSSNYSNPQQQPQRAQQQKQQPQSMVSTVKDIPSTTKNFCSSSSSSSSLKTANSFPHSLESDRIPPRPDMMKTSSESGGSHSSSNFEKEMLSIPSQIQVRLSSETISSKPVSTMESKVLTEVEKFDPKRGTLGFSQEMTTRLKDAQGPERATLLFSLLDQNNYRTVAKYAISIDVAILSKSIISYLSQDIDGTTFQIWYDSFLLENSNSTALSGSLGNRIRLVMDIFMAICYDQNSGQAYGLDLFKSIAARVIAGARARNYLPLYGWLCGMNKSLENIARIVEGYSNTLSIPTFPTFEPQTIVEEEKKKRRAEMESWMNFSSDEEGSDEDNSAPSPKATSTNVPDLTKSTTRGQENPGNVEDSWMMIDEEEVITSVGNNVQREQVEEVEELEEVGEELEVKDGLNEPPTSNSSKTDDEENGDAKAPENLTCKHYQLRSVGVNETLEDLQRGIAWQALNDFVELYLLLQIGQITGWNRSMQEMLNDIAHFVWTPFAPGFILALQMSCKQDLSDPSKHLISLFSTQYQVFSKELSNWNDNYSMMCKNNSIKNLALLLNQRNPQLSKLLGGEDCSVVDIHSFTWKGFWESYKDIYNAINLTLSGKALSLGELLGFQNLSNSISGVGSYLRNVVRHKDILQRGDEIEGQLTGKDIFRHAILVESALPASPHLTSQQFADVLWRKVLVNSSPSSEYDTIKYTFSFVHNKLWSQILNIFDDTNVGVRTGAVLTGTRLSAAVFTKMNSMREYLRSMVPHLLPHENVLHGIVVSKLDNYFTVYSNQHYYSKIHAVLQMEGQSQFFNSLAIFADYCSIRSEEVECVIESLDAIASHYLYNVAFCNLATLPETKDNAQNKNVGINSIDDIFNMEIEEEKPDSNDTNLSTTPMISADVIMLVEKVRKCYEELALLIAMFLVEKHVFIYIYQLRGLCIHLCRQLYEQHCQQSMTSIISCALEVLRIIHSVPAPWRLVEQHVDIQLLSIIKERRHFVLGNHSRLLRTESLLSRLYSMRGPLAVVINLDRRPDRWLRALSQCAKWKFSAVRFPAVDGMSLKGDPSLVPEKLVSTSWNTSLNCQFDFKCSKNNDVPLTSTERACAMSHLLIWKAIEKLYVQGKDEDSGLPPIVEKLSQSLLFYRNISQNILKDYFLIMEDDAHLRINPLTTYFSDIPNQMNVRTIYHNSLIEELQYIIQRLPKSTDICYLGRVLPWKSKEFKSQPIKSIFLRVNYVWNLHAYLINGRSVEKIMSYLPINMPVDNFLASLAHSQALEVLVLAKPIADQGSFAHRKPDSDIFHSGTADKALAFYNNKDNKAPSSVNNSAKRVRRK